MTDSPLIYTSKGNIPISDLFYKTVMVDHQILNTKLEIIDGKIVPVIDKDGHIEFIEEYYIGSEDDYIHGKAELVKRNVHILKFKGIKMDNEQGFL